MDSEGVLLLEEMLVDAAIDVTAWPRALDFITTRLGAYGAVLLPLIGRGPSVPMTESLAPLVDDYFARRWHERDVRSRAMPKLVRSGFSVDQDVFDLDEMTRDPYWADFLNRQSLQWFAGIRVSAGEDIWCLALQRTPSQGAFTLAEQAGFLRLGASLSRSARLQRRLGEARLDGMTDALHVLDVPAVMLDRQARVVRRNEAFEALLGKPFALRRGELSVVDRSDVTEALRRHVEAVLRPDLDPAASLLMGVPVPRDGLRPLVVQAHALRGAMANHFSPGRALVLITDMEIAPSPSRDLLKLLFALTDSESRLVQALAEGRSLTSAAARMGVTYETARSYLKSVFSKTGARGQNDLLMLAARLSRHAAGR